VSGARNWLFDVFCAFLLCLLVHLLLFCSGDGGLSWVFFEEFSVFQIIVHEGCRQRACAQHKYGHTCLRKHFLSPIHAGSTGLPLGLLFLGMVFPFFSPFFFDIDGSLADIRVVEICS
jgi:hypothetical protein